MDGSRRGPAKAVEAKDPRFAPLKRFLLSDIDVGDAAIAVSQQLSHVDGTNDGGGNHQFSPPKEITLGPAADAVNSGYVADPKDTFDRLAELSALRKGGHVELDDHIWHQISEEARKEAFDSTPYFLALLEQNGWSRANGGVFQTQVTAIQDGVEQVREGTQDRPALTLSPLAGRAVPHGSGTGILAALSRNGRPRR